MRLSKRLDQLPVEDWAARAAGAMRRMRRRLARRRGATLAALSCLAGVVLIATNALWRQSEPHPAPFWGEGGSDGTLVREVTPQEPTRERSELVARIQEALRAEGYDGAANGVLDAATSTAIAGFEAANGLPITGKPSLGLVAVLDASDPSPGAAAPNPQGAGSEVAAHGAQVDVAALQRLLNARGYGPLAVDGVLGPRTRAALAAYAGTAEGRSAIPSRLRALADEGA